MAETLSRREVQVLQARVDTGCHKLAARQLGISVGTVKNHLWAIHRALGARTTAQAAAICYVRGQIAWRGEYGAARH